MPLKVIVAGGGTAGHINPGIAIAKHIKANIKDADILFVGTDRGLEKDLVPREGFTLKTINVRGFRRKLSFQTLQAFAGIFTGFAQAAKIIGEFKPDIVIGTGGYVCGPVLLFAALSHIPTLIHEQNAFPGITNKILARFVDAVAVSFEESVKFFSKSKKISVTGNPVKDEILHANRNEARAKKHVGEDIPFVLIAGGSLGAERLNDAVADMLINGYAEGDFKLLFATGQKKYDETVNKIKELKKSVLDIKDVEIVPYIYDMNHSMAAADLMVTRGGAITASELTVMGVPAIIVPSPNVTANHQEYNARALENKGAAVVLLEKDLTGNRLYDLIMELLNDKERLKKMSESSKAIGIRDASDRIFELIKGLIGDNG